MLKHYMEHIHRELELDDAVLKPCHPVWYGFATQDAPDLPEHKGKFLNYNEVQLESRRIIMRLSVLSVSAVIWTAMIWGMWIAYIRLRARQLRKYRSLIDLKHNWVRIERTGGRAGVLVESMPAAIENATLRCEAEFPL